MKTFNKIMTIIGLMAIAMTAQAQKPIQSVSQAFDEFCGKIYKGRYVTSSTQSDYKDGYYKNVNFALPEKKKGDVTDYDGILIDNNRLSYSSFFKKANTNDKSTFAVAYGDNNSATKKYGTYGNHNYNVQAIRDMKDSTMRYVYTLDWYTRGDSIIGSVEKIYGKDPRIKKRSELTDGVDLSEIQSLLKVVFELGNDSITVNSDEDIIQKINDLQIVYSKLNDKYKDYTKCSGSKRLDMLNVRRLMLATNTQIRGLVNTGRLGKMLSSDDKEFIADQLNEMSNESKDKWLKKSLKDLSTSLIEK